MLTILSLKSIYEAVVAIFEIALVIIDILQIVLILGLGISGLLIFIFTLIPGPEPEKTLQKVYNMFGKFLKYLRLVSKK